MQCVELYEELVDDISRNSGVASCLPLFSLLLIAL